MAGFATSIPVTGLPASERKASTSLPSDAAVSHVLPCGLTETLRLFDWSALSCFALSEAFASCSAMAVMGFLKRTLAAFVIVMRSSKACLKAVIVAAMNAASSFVIAWSIWFL